MGSRQSHVDYNYMHDTLLTESMIGMREEESIQRQGEDEDQVRDEVDEESGSPVDSPFVIQQAGHDWVSQQVCM